MATETLPETPLHTPDDDASIVGGDRVVMWMFLLGMLMFGLYLIGDLVMGVLDSARL